MQENEREEIVLADGKTYIAAGEFRLFRRLKHITILNSVTHVGACAFEDCASLSHIYAEGTKGIGFGGYWLEGCKAEVHWGEGQS